MLLSLDDTRLLELLEELLKYGDGFVKVLQFFIAVDIAEIPLREDEEESEETLSERAKETLHFISIKHPGIFGLDCYAPPIIIMQLRESMIRNSNCEKSDEKRHQIRKVESLSGEEHTIEEAVERLAFFVQHTIKFSPSLLLIQKRKSKSSPAAASIHYNTNNNVCEMLLCMKKLSLTNFESLVLSNSSEENSLSCTTPLGSSSNHLYKKKYMLRTSKEDMVYYTLEMDNNMIACSYAKYYSRRIIPSATDNPPIPSLPQVENNQVWAGEIEPITFNSSFILSTRPHDVNQFDVQLTTKETAVLLLYSNLNVQQKQELIWQEGIILSIEYIEWLTAEAEKRDNCKMMNLLEYHLSQLKPSLREISHNRLRCFPHFCEQCTTQRAQLAIHLDAALNKLSTRLPNGTQLSEDERTLLINNYIKRRHPQLNDSDKGGQPMLSWPLIRLLASQSMSIEQRAHDIHLAAGLKCNKLDKRRGRFLLKPNLLSTNMYRAKPKSSVSSRFGIIGIPEEEENDGQQEETSDDQVTDDVKVKTANDKKTNGKQDETSYDYELNDEQEETSDDPVQDDEQVELSDDQEQEADKLARLIQSKGAEHPRIQELKAPPKSSTKSTSEKYNRRWSNAEMKRNLQLVNGDDDLPPIPQVDFPAPQQIVVHSNL